MEKKKKKKKVESDRVVHNEDPKASDSDRSEGEFKDSKSKKQKRRERRSQERSASREKLGDSETPRDTNDIDDASENVRAVYRQTAIRGAVNNAVAQRDRAMILAEKEKASAMVRPNPDAAPFVPKDVSAGEVKGASGASTPPGMPGLLDSEDEIEIEKDISLFVVEGVDGGPKKDDNHAEKILSESRGCPIRDPLPSGRLPLNYSGRLTKA